MDVRHIKNSCILIILFNTIISFQLVKSLVLMLPIRLRLSKFFFILTAKVFLVLNSCLSFAFKRKHYAHLERHPRIQ